MLQNKKKKLNILELHTTNHDKHTHTQHTTSHDIHTYTHTQHISTSGCSSGGSG